VNASWLMGRLSAILLFLCCAATVSAQDWRGRGDGPGRRPTPIIASHSNKCVDVYGASADNGAAVIQWSCHYGDNQTWRFEWQGNGMYQIVAQHSGKCLDLNLNSPGRGYNNGDRIIQWDCHGGQNQKWYVVAVGDGYQIRSAFSRKCLDVSGVSTADGAPMHQWECLGPQQRNQIFSLRARGRRSSGGREGWQNIQNRWKPDHLLGTATCEHPRVMVYNGRMRERRYSFVQWMLEPVEGSPFVRIRSRVDFGEDLYLHIEHGRLELGEIEPGWWSAMWTLQPVDDGFYRIQNRWKPDQYIHIEHGDVEVGQAPPGWWSAMWKFDRAPAAVRHADCD